MAPESMQKRLTRISPPRVQTSYDLQVGDAIELKELPFAPGSMCDFTGQSIDTLPRLKYRRFVDVNPTNFDSVLESMKPHLPFKMDLCSLESFESEQVKAQISLGSESSELRGKLGNSPRTLQTNEQLNQIQMEAVSRDDMLDTPRSEMNSKANQDGVGSKIKRERGE